MTTGETQSSYSWGLQGGVCVTEPVGVLSQQAHNAVRVGKGGGITQAVRVAVMSNKYGACVQRQIIARSQLLSFA